MIDFSNKGGFLMSEKAILVTIQEINLLIYYLHATFMFFNYGTIIAVCTFTFKLFL